MLTNAHYNLMLVFIYSLFSTYVAKQYFAEKLRKYNYLVYDKYKRGKVKVPTMGGLAMLSGVMVALALSQLLIEGDTTGHLFIFYFIVIVYALYGVLDDIFSFRKRYDKIIVLLVLSLPIASLLGRDTIEVIGFSLYLGVFLKYVIAPLYIMVTANLINVYSGFNGLSSGLALILLITVGIKSYLLYGITNLLFLIPMLGALVSFFPSTFYPARILEGNVGQFMAGSVLGAFLVISGLEVFGVVILIPHIVNFILDTWVLAVKKVPDIKYGSVRKNGTIIAPKPVRFKSLKFMLTYYVRLREEEAVVLLYVPTVIFCIVGVVFF